MNTLLKPLKVIALNGSPNKKGNTYRCIQKMFETFKQNKVETEILQIGSKKIEGCHACFACGKNKNFKCVIDNDCLNESIEKIRKADGLIAASPVYFAGPTGKLKCFLDRLGFVSMNNKEEHGKRMLWHKVCAGISVHARGGGTNTLSQLNYFFSINGAVVPGSIYWNFAVGKGKGEVDADVFGMKNMQDLAKEMTNLMQMVRDNKMKK
ncbi:nad(p)h-dependent fmn-containing oxidoreductase ywqn-related [Anaeramoeba flamelloides]|uniref:Nad(P)h-dependent fmn-containing oxidoreductase ywqn-related n=1 Tax=Anaeramoeba flamelloides TaxID=1746091 RepID=A0AAV7YKF4_9EUKA|nr:nad(p)h-dependent fmn-containing oxidoreductase ywqn-related [Anaeramoeba flamelloides]KAJ6254112.1 nad(p)h-dependent fmn-containing oxidoreductase ywqn-related [Anaeramoeba flamelloides]